MELVNVLTKLIGISMVVAAVGCSSAIPIEVEPTRRADLAVRSKATSNPATRIPSTITQVQIKPAPNENSTSIALFDAHNHMPKGLTAEKIISVMDQENIARMILMGKGGPTSRDVTTLQAYDQFPDRIVPFIGLNGYTAKNFTPEFFDYLDRQFGDGEFLGMGELLSRHYSFSTGALGTTLKAPDFDFSMDQPIVHDLMCLASKHDVVLMVHMEAEDETILALERALSDNPDAKVIWAHQTHLKTFGGSTKEHTHKADPSGIGRVAERISEFVRGYCRGS
jgi:Tat protein secretion system quality control protein TatD with DNase activity